VLGYVPRSAARGARREVGEDAAEGEAAVKEEAEEAGTVVVVASAAAAAAAAAAAVVAVLLVHIRMVKVLGAPAVPRRAPAVPVALEGHKVELALWVRGVGGKGGVRTEAAMCPRAHHVLTQDWLTPS
jgi:hypothetical protein